MAKDRSKLFVKDVSTEGIYNISEWEFKKPHRASRLYKYGSLQYIKDDTYLRLMMYSLTKGDLFIDVNPAKLMYGELGSLNEDVDSNDICKLLDKEVLGVFKDADFFSSKIEIMKYSTTEIYIDYTAPKQRVNDLYEFIKKIKVPHMERLSKYESSGTIYFCRGSSLKSSNIIFKVYLKHLELQRKGFELNSLIGILRFEVSLKRRKLRYDYNNRPKLKSKESYKFLKDNEDSVYSLECDQLIDLYENGCEFDAFNSRLYQNQILYEFLIKKFNLDKHITTKDHLVKVIQDNFSPKKQNKYLQVISYLNGEIDQINMVDKSVTACKRRILDLGYHYLYFERDLGVIDIEDLLLNA